MRRAIWNVVTLFDLDGVNMLPFSKPRPLTFLIKGLEEKVVLDHIAVTGSCHLLEIPTFGANVFNSKTGVEVKFNEPLTSDPIPRSWPFRYHVLSFYPQREAAIVQAITKRCLHFTEIILE